MEDEFPTTPLYLDDAERKRHESAINRLCEELSVRRPAMEKAYNEVLLELKSKARIQDYLTIFAIRTIRDRYQHANGAVHKRS